MLSIFRHLMKNDDGATAIEYALIASLISLTGNTPMESRRRRSPWLWVAESPWRGRGGRLAD